MAVTAKVVVDKSTSNNDGVTMVTMSADYSDGANKEWAKYTPALSVTIHVKSEIAEKHFKPSTHLTLTFEEE